MLGVFPIVMPVFHSYFVLLHSRFRLQNASIISIVRRIQRASMAYANAKTSLSRTKRPANQVKCHCACLKMPNNLLEWLYYTFASIRIFFHKHQPKTQKLAQSKQNRIGWNYAGWFRWVLSLNVVGFTVFHFWRPYDVCFWLPGFCFDELK